MVELTLKDIMTNEYYECKAENSSTKIGGFILHQKKNGEYRSCELVKKKEVKKVSKQVDYKKLSYFETKVVKVKKEKENRKPNIYSVKCTNCGHFTSVDIDEKKFKKGNWINGENLDKIKFPVPCNYISHTGIKYHALLIKDRYKGEDKYELLRISQDNGGSIFFSSNSLKELIEKYNIHILKGKIILFEEE